MSSTLHPFVRNLVIVPSRRFIATTATIATFAVGSLRAQQYDSMAGPDDPFDVQTPSVDEYITVGGFQLRVDRTKWDINLDPGNRGLLGRLEGNDVAISIREIACPKSTTVTDKASLETDSVQIERVFTSHAIGGLKGRLWRKDIAYQPEDQGDSLSLRQSRRQNDLLRGTREDPSSRLVRCQ